jgi:hypothetical protein
MAASAFVIEDGDQRLGLIGELVVEAARAHAGWLVDVGRDIDAVVPMLQEGGSFGLEQSGSGLPRTG